MKMLVAYDGFEYSHPALEEAARLAREERATITVLSVVPPAARGTKSGGHVGLQPHADDDVHYARTYLLEQGVIAETKAVHGDPAEEILKEARAGHHDLVVTGTRGRGPVARLLLGSVSREISENAPCTVLIVSADHTVRIEPRVVVEPRTAVGA